MAIGRTKRAAMSVEPTGLEPRCARCPIAPNAERAGSRGRLLQIVPSSRVPLWLRDAHNPANASERRATLDRYTHVLPGELEWAREQLDQYLASASTRSVSVYRSIALSSTEMLRCRRSMLLLRPGRAPRGNCGSPRSQIELSAPAARSSGRAPIRRSDRPLQRPDLSRAAARLYRAPGSGSATNLLGIQIRDKKRL
jgi:hypothetical protein